MLCVDVKASSKVPRMAPAVAVVEPQTQATVESTRQRYLQSRTSVFFEFTNKTHQLVSKLSSDSEL